MEIRAFRGWRFASTDVSGHIAPPYDVLNGQQKQALLAGCERNIVGIDLPHVPPKEPAPDAVYAAAAAALARWQSDGTLAKEAAPALYVYDQTYTWAGESCTRRALLAGVRATPLGADQDIIPHEHTFAGPKADRLKLTQATRMQLSPVFGLFSDDFGVGDLLAAQTARDPDAAGTLDGVQQKLWVISDAQAIGSLAQALAPVPAFIADGHHRYTTAMNYRDELLAAGEIDSDHEANFVLFALVAEDDPGLLVLPTHRLVTGLSAEFSLEALQAATAEFEWQTVEMPADLSDADTFLRAFGPSAMGFVAADGSQLAVARLTDTSAMAATAGDHSRPWRELDVAILQTLIMDGHLAVWKTAATAVDYTPDGNIARDAVRSGDAQLAALLQSTPVRAVQDVALAGDVMPHKSTYFYPKLATGMVLKPLE